MESWSFRYELGGARSRLVWPADHAHVEIARVAHDLVLLGLDLINVPIAPDHLVSKPLNVFADRPDHKVGGQVD